NEIRVIEAVDNNPHVSQRQISREIEISQSSVLRILKSERFHPYHVILVQALNEADYEKRIRFCHFMRDKMNQQLDFLRFVMFSDEAKFCNNGAVNRHNSHY
ncbi:HTH 24 domain containing protein, partial [Asbolus verrucosus]